MKGSWRPNLQKFVDSLSDAAVTGATTKAFECLAANDIDGAYKEATVLKGVGFATASALLAAYDPSIAFMGDEALIAAVGSRTYTKQEAAALKAACHAKAQQLAAALVGSGAGAAAVGGSGTGAASSSSSTSATAAAAPRVSALPWTANKVQLCLWAAEHYGNPAGKTPQVGWWKALAPASAAGAGATSAAPTAAPAAKRARLDGASSSGSGIAASAPTDSTAAAADAGARVGTGATAAADAAAGAPADGSVSGRKRKRA